MKSDNFDNYLKDHISTQELAELLSFFKKQAPGQPFLVLRVNDSGDGMVSGDATAWMGVSASRPDRLSYFLHDDDGKSELNTYEFSVPGLADCLDSLCSLQDELDYDGFYIAAKALIS